MIVQDLDHWNIADEIEHVYGGATATIQVTANAIAVGQNTSAKTYTQAFALKASYKWGS